MKKRADHAPKSNFPFSSGIIFLLGLLSIAAIAGIWLTKRHAEPTSKDRYEPRPHGSVTFNKDIAPILYNKCAPCHRPGESAPFNLITYKDAQSRATLIAKVTHARSMPPWLPEEGHEELLDKRTLSPEQIGLIAQWIQDGTPQGDASDLPAPPRWTEGWQLGPPDLVVTMPETYTLPAEGKDVYRNFIIPLPTTENRFVKAFEFRPACKVIHHAFVRLDRTHDSRRLARESAPGFPGMTIPPSVESPGGHFLSWQPGRGASPSPAGLPWILPGGADIVLLMHMQPTGKSEPVRPSIGFYFTDVPPTNAPIKIGLRSYNIDIPAGASNYVVEQSTTLPVDAQLLSVLPHAHYLGKKLEALALLPDRSTKTLLRIPDWDFNWQSDFRFATPVRLPKGTTLAMRYIYDNSTNNLRSPFQHPVPVKYGLQTTQEMAELHFQLLADNQKDFEKLRDTVNDIALKDAIAYNQHVLQEDPQNAEAILELAKLQVNPRNLMETAAAIRRAIALKPGLADAHYTLGIVLMDQSKIAEAEGAFLETVRLAPDHFRAWNNIGLICMNQGRLDEAAAHFQEVLRLRPGERIARENLDLVIKAKRQR